MTASFTERATGTDRGPYAVAVLDERPWFTEIHSGTLARLDADERVQRWDLGSGSRPSSLATTPDGTLWCALGGTGMLARFRDGARQSHAVVSTAEAGLFGLAAAPDGSVWFTELQGGRIGRYRPGEGVRHVDVPGGGFPSMIAWGSDDAAWFTLNATSAVGRIAADGELDVIALPTPAAGPVGIAADPSGGVWVTELLAGRIARIDAAGGVREIPLPDPTCRPHAITVAADGACWFTEWGSSAVGRIAVDGRLDEVMLRTGSEPHGIAVAPAGDVWVALEDGALAHVVP